MFLCKTYVESGHSVLNWEIEKFSLICPDPSLVSLKKERGKEFFARNKAVYSPTVPVNAILNDSTTNQNRNADKAGPRLEWYVSMEFIAGTGEPNDTSEPVDNYIAMYLFAKDLSQEPDNVIGLIFSMSIIGPKDNVIHKLTATMPPSHTRESRGWGWSKFLSVEKLYRHEHNYLVNDTLNIRIELDFSSKLVTKDLHGIPPSCQPLLANDLHSDLEQLLKSQQDADLTVHCRDRTFLLHSNIIKARSPVIKRMLETDMVESINKTVKIEDVDPADFEAFIGYIYTSKIGFALDDVSRLSGVVQLADKYEVETLKTFCFQHIAEQISLENAGEIAVLAYLHCAGDQLREKVVKFCTQNWSALSKTENFRNCVHQNAPAFFTN